MYKFGENSKKKLKICSPAIQKLCFRAIIYVEIDFGIVCGHRDKVMQDSLFRSGHSKVQYPNSKHNTNPSNAVDIAVYDHELKKFIWEPLSYYYYLYGVFMTIANQEGIKLRWGGNWDGDADFTDNPFLDCGHYELIL